MNSNYSRFTSELKVRPDDIDMNNHVHSAKYLDYVLAARYEQMERDYKMSMDDFHRLGFGWVIRSVLINFVRPLMLGDEMLIETQLESYSGARSEVRFCIKKKSSLKTAADGKILYTMVSLKNGKPARIPEEIIKKYTI